MVNINKNTCYFFFNPFICILMISSQKKDGNYYKYGRVSTIQIMYTLVECIQMNSLNNNQGRQQEMLPPLTQYTFSSVHFTYKYSYPGIVHFTHSAKAFASSATCLSSSRCRYSNNWFVLHTMALCSGSCSIASPHLPQYLFFVYHCPKCDTVTAAKYSHSDFASVSMWIGAYSSLPLLKSNTS